MLTNTFEFKSQVWVYPGLASWYFVTVPKNISARIKILYGPMKRGFGSLPVKAKINQTEWKTSIFPDSKRGAYMLPIKAGVRKKEGVGAGKTIDLIIEVLV